MYLNIIIKVMYNKLTANIISMVKKKLKSFCFKIRNKTGVLTLTTFIQQSIGSPSHSNQTRKRNRRNPNWKRRSKTVTILDDMILYTENPKNSTKKPLELINEFSKVAEYEFNIQNSVAFLYTNSKLQEELRK